MLKFCHKKNHNNRGNTEIVILVTIVIFLVSLISGIFYYNLKSRSVKKINPIPSAPAPTPTPKPIPNGKQEYEIQTTKVTGPIPFAISINPYDPKINGNQVVTISLRDTAVITKATYKLTTDNNQIKIIELKLVSGTALNGQWQGSTTIDNSYDHIYSMIFEAVDTKNQTLNYEFPLR